MQSEVLIPEYITIGAVNYRVVAIENCAFQNDEILESISIPASVEMLGNDSFNGCNNLHKIVIADSEEPLKLGFSSLNKTENYTNSEFSYYGATVKSIIRRFQGIFCDTELRDLYIGRPLSYRLFDYDFKSYNICYIVDNLYASPFASLTSLEKIIIGGNATCLCVNAGEAPQNKDVGEPLGTFGDCESIKTVQSHNVIPPTGVSFSESTYEAAQLIVPDNTINLYQVADGWKDFVNIVDETSAGIEIVSNDNARTPFTISNGGFTWVGDSSVLSIYTVDGRLQMYQYIQTGERLQLEAGLYIVKSTIGTFKVRL